MGLHYGIKQPVRFYNSLNQQNRFRKGAGATVFKLISPNDYILPFQIRRPAGVMPITVFKYVSVEDGSEINLLTAIASFELETFPFSDFDQIVHYGSESHSAIVPEGDYYLEVSDGVSTWYSEVISVIDFDTTLQTSSCVLSKIEYWSTCDIADVYFRGAKQYKNIVYLDLDIGKPNYPYNEEGTQDAEGNFKEDYKRLDKQYFIQGVFPEYFLDAITQLPLYTGTTGTVEITTHRGITGDVDTIAVNPEWQDDYGVWAKTDILFVTEYIFKANCCDSEEQLFSKCIRQSLPVVATVVENSSDYNNFEYTSASDGSKIPFQDGDRLLVLLSSGDAVYREYDETGSQYTTPLAIFSKGDVLEDQNELNGNSLAPVIYYYKKQTGNAFASEPKIISLTGTLVTGEVFNGTAVNVIALGPFGEQSLGYITGDDFNASGFSFTPIANMTGVKIEVTGLTCNLGESNDVDVDTFAIPNMTIGDDFIVT